MATQQNFTLMGTNAKNTYVGRIPLKHFASDADPMGALITILLLYLFIKTCLRHPESISARENRDTVFCQMRRAMDLIHYVVKDGVIDSAASLVACPSATQPIRNPKEVRK